MSGTRDTHGKASMPASTIQHAQAHAPASVDGSKQTDAGAKGKAREEPAAATSKAASSNAPKKLQPQPQPQSAATLENDKAAEFLENAEMARMVRQDESLPKPCAEMLATMIEAGMSDDAINGVQGAMLNILDVKDERERAQIDALLDLDTETLCAAALSQIQAKERREGS